MTIFFHAPHTSSEYWTAGAYMGWGGMRPWRPLYTTEMQSSFFRFFLHCNQSCTFTFTFAVIPPALLWRQLFESLKLWQKCFARWKTRIFCHIWHINVCFWGPSQWWRQLCVNAFLTLHNNLLFKSQGFSNLFPRLYRLPTAPWPDRCWPTAWLLCGATEAVHRRIGEPPRLCTWPWCWGSPGPSLEMRGGSDNRLLRVRHGHKERGAAAAGVASTWWSVRLLMAQALSRPPSSKPHTTSCRVRLWAHQHREAAARHSWYIFLFIYFTCPWTSFTEAKRWGRSCGKFAIFFFLHFFVFYFAIFAKPLAWKIVLERTLLELLTRKSNQL